MAFIRESILDWVNDGAAMPDIDFNDIYFTDEELNDMHDNITAKCVLRLEIDDKDSPGEAESVTEINQVWTSVPASAVNDMHELMTLLYTTAQKVSSSWGDAVEEANEAAGGDRAKRDQILREQNKARRKARREALAGARGG